MAVEQKEATSNNNNNNGGLEWRVSRVSEDGSSQVVAPNRGLFGRMLARVESLFVAVVSSVSGFFRKAWEVACNDPRKVIHCLKVGIALTAVSFFYYMRPLNEGVGGNAMWAVMTVVVVFENTVGATLCKSLNRICGTTLAGFIAVGVHWIADKSGDKFEPFVTGMAMFILASAVTFSRFIPSVKARFDYGAMIFILTFSLVSVSGYRVEKLFEMAHNRMSTIIIGTSLCMLIIMFICPIWAGQELHSLVIRNMDKLSDSLDGCVSEYFNTSEEESKESTKQATKNNLLGYRCVLSSKATEEIMANFAKWEPAHGRFNFRHPWSQYVKIGAAMRSCAYCIEALNGCINSDNKASEELKKRINGACLELSSNSSSVIKELGNVIKTMKKSSSLDFLVGQMNSSVQDLNDGLKSLPGSLVSQQQTQLSLSIPIFEIIPLVTLTSLLIEIASRIEAMVDEVEKLADSAGFEPVDDEKIKSNKLVIKVLH